MPRQLPELSAHKPIGDGRGGQGEPYVRVRGKLGICGRDLRSGRVKLA